MRRPIVLLVSVAALVACAAPAPAPPDLDPRDWAAVLTAADGQTLDWYLFGGDENINGVVEGYVADRLAENGITLRTVPVADTADAVNKVLTEQQAGRTTDGTVDAIWINGENFATGMQADLWFCGWPDALPNARFVDLTDPAVAADFGVPVDGCESAWQRSSSALVYDGAQLGAADVASLPALEAWARVNPGRFTYAAPPDFTGALAVRTFLYDQIGGDPAVLTDGPTAFEGPVADGLWARLNALEPALWRAGETYPTSHDAVEQLYATGEIAAFFTYGPGTVATRVADGTFPDSTRSAVLDIGNIGNVSNIAIPANSPDKAAALVLADLLQDPATQLRFYADAGIAPVIELDRLDAAGQEAFAAVPVAPSVLAPEVLAANARPELGAELVQRIEDGWVARVLQE